MTTLTPEQQTQGFTLGEILALTLEQAHRASARVPANQKNIRPAQVAGCLTKSNSIYEY